MHQLHAVRCDHEALQHKNYEESLKLSIMAKESEIAESSRQKKKELKKKAVGIVVKKGFGAVFKGIKTVKAQMPWSDGTPGEKPQKTISTGIGEQPVI